MVIFQYDIDLQTNGFEYITLKDKQNQVIAFEKSNLLFVFNFNCSNSFTDYHVPVRNEGIYRCILTVLDSFHILIYRTICQSTMETIESPWHHFTNPILYQMGCACSISPFTVQHSVSVYSEEYSVCISLCSKDFISPIQVNTPIMKVNNKHSYQSTKSHYHTA